MPTSAYKTQTSEEAASLVPNAAIVAAVSHSLVGQTDDVFMPAGTERTIPLHRRLSAWPKRT